MFIDFHQKKNYMRHIFILLFFLETTPKVHTKIAIPGPIPLLSKSPLPILKISHLPYKFLMINQLTETDD